MEVGWWVVSLRIFWENRPKIALNQAVGLPLVPGILEPVGPIPVPCVFCFVNCICLYIAKSCYDLSVLSMSDGFPKKSLYSGWLGCCTFALMPRGWISRLEKPTTFKFAHDLPVAVFLVFAKKYSPTGHILF